MVLDEGKMIRREAGQNWKVEKWRVEIFFRPQLLESFTPNLLPALPCPSPHSRVANCTPAWAAVPWSFDNQQSLFFNRQSSMLATWQARRIDDCRAIDF
jgi:hypothetical protein